MRAFADVEDYASRYGSPTDPERVETLLEDAAVYIESEMRRSGVAVDEEDDLQAATLARVSCRIVHDQVDVDDGLVAVSSASETVGPFTWQRSFSQSYGKPFLYADEKRQLGIGGVRCGSVEPRAVK